MAALCAELPNSLMAATRKVWLVLGARPHTEAVVFGVCWFCVPSMNTRYWTVQLAPGVEGFQRRSMHVLVWLGDVSPVGTLGSTEQPALASVRTLSAALWAEALPALARARTRKENAVFGVSPVLVK